MVRTSGPLAQGRYHELQAVARDLEGHADFWVQYDVGQHNGSTSRQAAALRAASVRVPNFRVHVTSTPDVVRAFRFLHGNWLSGEALHSWGNLGRQQHETFVLAWWRGLPPGTYDSVWVVEDDVRFGGNVSRFLAAMDSQHGRCAPKPADYAGAELKPSFERSGSAYLRRQWHNWDKARFISHAFDERVPMLHRVRKVEYVEKYSARLLATLAEALADGVFAFGELFASSLCSAAPWCRLVDIACCPPTSSWEYLKHCKYSGLPRGR